MDNVDPVGKITIIPKVTKVAVHSKEYNERCQCKRFKQGQCILCVDSYHKYGDSYKVEGVFFEGVKIVVEKCPSQKERQLSRELLGMNEAYSTGKNKTKQVNVVLSKSRVNGFQL